MSNVERDPSANLDALGQLAREGFSDQTSDIAHHAGKRQLHATLAAQNGTELTGSRGRPVRLMAGLAAAAAVVAIVAVFAVRALGPQPLSFTVDPKLAQGEYLQPPTAGSNAEVRFSDGSELRLDAGGRARVASTTPSGAQLVLERGHAELHVVHRPNTRWSFAAGPYQVIVTGTRFTVDWLADEERLQVEVTEGSVRVQSAGKQEGIAVGAGQRLIATAKDARFELGPAIDVGARHAFDRAQAGAVPPPDDIDNAPPPAEQAPAVNSDAPETASSWSKRVAAGEFASVLDAAHERGVENVLTQAALPDLVALADAARYTSNVALARKALQAQRARFAGTSAARAAAFLMGRLTEDQLHDTQNALGWYNTYLAEAPQGAFAAEALGRRLVLLERSAGAAAARDSAQNYLRRFPDGPYARVAQQILSAP
jgi:hypothetical protein